MAKCDSCHTFIPDSEAVYGLEMPDLLSMEHFTEGYQRAEKNPPTNDQRPGCIIAATLWLSRLPGGVPDFDQDQMAIAGKALMEMGGKLVTLHKHCAPSATN
jgi:hypothetical protein